MKKILSLLTFEKFLETRIKTKSIFNTNVIPTYKWLYKLLVTIFLLMILMIISILINYPILVAISLLPSIILMFFLPIWIIFNQHILRSDKFIAFIGGLFFTIMIFAISYYILHDLEGNKAFQINTPITNNSLITWIYYSIIVFSTVGFGDITPIGTLTIIFTILEITLHYIYIIFGASLLFQSSDMNDNIITSELKSYLKKRE